LKQAFGKRVIDLQAANKLPINHSYFTSLPIQLGNEANKLLSKSLVVFQRAYKAGLGLGHTDIFRKTILGSHRHIFTTQTKARGPKQDLKIASFRFLVIQETRQFFSKI
jgi:hypothetical protein